MTYKSYADLEKENADLRAALEKLAQDLAEALELLKAYRQLESE